MSSWDIFVHSFIDKGGYVNVLNGLKTTVIIAVVGLLIGIVIGTIIAITKVVPQTNIGIRILSTIGNLYVTLFRGTPIIVQLLLIYYVLFPALSLSPRQLGIDIESYRTVVAVAVYGMNSGAYVSEIMRGGINSIDRGQMEAGRALGLSYGTTMLRVVIPQSIKNILPTLGNEFIALIKDTSVVSFIAVVDLTKAFTTIASSNYEYIVPYCILALIYLVLVIMITIIVRLIERGFAKSDRKQ